MTDGRGEEGARTQAHMMEPTAPPGVAAPGGRWPGCVPTPPDRALQMLRRPWSLGSICPSVREATQAWRAEPRSPTAPPSPSPTVPSTEGRQESHDDAGLYPWVAHADTPL